MSISNVYDISLDSSTSFLPQINGSIKFTTSLGQTVVSTDNLLEGSSNIFFTTSRVNSVVNSNSNVINGNTAYSWGNHSTSGYLLRSGGTMTGSLILNADPTNPLGATTKQYVDNYIQGLVWKQKARVISTTNITLSGTQTINTVALSIDDVVLVNGQSTQTENGLYNVKSGAWVRTLDADTGAEIFNSAIFVGDEGNVFPNTQWANGNSTPITIGSTNIVFNQIAGVGTYSAGTALTLTGNTFSVQTNGITNSLIRQSVATSIIGNATGSTANVSDITAGSDGQLLVRRSGALTFGTLLSSDIPSLDMSKITTGNLAWSRISSTPTTISGYGITDGVTLTGIETLTNKTLTTPVINIGSDATGDVYYRNGSGAFTRLGIGSTNQILQVISGVPSWQTPVNQTITLTSDVTGSGTGSFATTISANAVTFAKFQQLPTVSLVGNSTGSTANAQSITLGSGLGFTGTVLNNVSKNIFIATATTTYTQSIAGVQADTTLFGTGLGSLTLGANSVVVGDEYQVRLKGYLNITTTGTFTLKIKIGSTTIATQSAIVIAAPKSNTLIDLDFCFTPRTIGASGTVFGQGSCLISVGGTSTPVFSQLVMTGAATIDFTSAQIIDTTISWTSGFIGSVNITNATLRLERF